MGPLGYTETFVTTNLYCVTSRYSGNVSALHVILISVGYCTVCLPLGCCPSSIILNISVSVLDNMCKCVGERRVTAYSACDG